MTDSVIELIAKTISQQRILRTSAEEIAEKVREALTERGLAVVDSRQVRRLLDDHQALSRSVAPRYGVNVRQRIRDQLNPSEVEPQDPQAEEARVRRYAEAISNASACLGYKAFDTPESFEWAARAVVAFVDDETRALAEEVSEDVGVIRMLRRREQNAEDAAELLRGKVEALTREREDLEALLSSLWLYIEWRAVTRKLTPDQRELFADAIEAWSRKHNGDDAVRVPRWWRWDES